MTKTLDELVRESSFDEAPVAAEPFGRDADYTLAGYEGGFVGVVWTCNRERLREAVGIRDDPLDIYIWLTEEDLEQALRMLRRTRKQADPEGPVEPARRRVRIRQRGD